MTIVEEGVFLNFTYFDYRGLIQKLRFHGYCFNDYHTFVSGKEVIFRHDVDIHPKYAVRISEIEREEGVVSTYFVMLRNEMYNVASKEVIKLIKQIVDNGHIIGLHFDETYYSRNEEIVSNIKKEAELLEQLLDVPIASVSMHMPSEETLNADFYIEGMINSYSKKYTKEYKYLSDSMMRWRENVDDIIESEKYEKLHILTHPIWYNETCLQVKEIIERDAVFKNKELNECWKMIYPQI